MGLGALFEFSNAPRSGFEPEGIDLALFKKSVRMDEMEVPYPIARLLLFKLKESLKFGSELITFLNAAIEPEKLSIPDLPPSIIQLLMKNLVRTPSILMFLLFPKTIEFVK